MDHAGAEDDRQAAARKRPQQRAHPAHAGVGVSLIGAHEHHLGQLPLADVGGRDERQAVAARAVEEVVRPVARQRLEQRPAVLTQQAGVEDPLEDRLAVAQDAQVERDRSRVETGYSGHMIAP